MKQYLLIIWFTIVGFYANAQEPNDCINAITVCGNGNFISNATGIGSTQEISSCGGFENNTIWLNINIAQAGTLGFDLIPSDPDISVDYDFWVFGPNSACDNLGSPIRCATTNPQQAGLSSNHTGINGGTTVTQSGPGANGSGYVYWLNVNVGQSYYIAIDRPAGDGGFEIEWTGTATENGGAFPIPPEANAIEDLKACSNNSDIAIFDLNSAKSSVNSDLTNNTVDFFETMADAIDGVNPLPGIYANNVNPQPIFGKVTSNGTDCYSLVEFNLVVSPVPEATVSASANEVCFGEEVTFTITGTPDATILYSINNEPTQDILLNNAGTATLTQTLTEDTLLELQEAQIVNGSNQVVCSQMISDSVNVSVNTNTIPTITPNTPICEGETAALTFTGEPNATITYLVNGNSMTFNLDASGNYILEFPNVASTFQVLIESVTSAVSPFCNLEINSTETIQVNPLPTVVDPNPLTACNDGTNPNGAAFNLDDQSATISNNATNVTVEYYENQVFAEQGDSNNALASPYETNLANQTIFVRVETDLGCVDYTTLNLQVLDAPIANSVNPLQACDVNSLGIETFNLTEAEADIVSGNTQGVIVTYHLSVADAEDNVMQITNPDAFDNTTPYNQTIHVRVSSQTTNCFAVVPLNLEVFDTPSITQVSPYILCDNDEDGIEVFDLTTLNTTVLGSQDPSLHQITFYQTEIEANTPTSAIINPQAYTNENLGGETLWVRLEHNTTGCFSVSSFDIIAEAPLELDENYTASVCDNDGDGQYTYNLLDYTSQILASTNNTENYQVDFYPTQQEAVDNINIITTPESYTINADTQTTLGVRVTTISSNCWNTTALNLEITVLPDPNTTQLDPLSTCDSITPNDGNETFNLTEVEPLLSNGIANLSFSYHISETNAEQGNPLIADSTNFNTGTTTVYIRVVSAVDSNTNCYAIFPLQLIVNPEPEIASSGTSVCSSNGNGFFEFDLQAEIPSILGSNQDISDYMVSFYEDVTTTTEITTNPYTNTIAYQQEIFVEITNNVSNCSKVFPFELTVEDAATATMPATFSVCDDDGEEDGLATFDLTMLNSEILNGQDPNTYDVSFYETEQMAIEGDSPIINLEGYQNTIPNDQTLFIRVINANVPNECFAITSVDLEVTPILKPQIHSVDGSNTLCVDFETEALQNELTLQSDLQSDNYMYTWFLDGAEIPGANQPTYTINTVAPGLYTVAITEISMESNCTPQVSNAFEVIKSGQAVLINVSQSTSFQPNPSITVTVEGYGEYWFQLNDGEILDNNGVFNNVVGGTHTVTVYDRKTPFSCGVLSIEDITIIDFPRFFTPNNDGFNDRWNVFALQDQKEAIINIFDRYGKLLTSIKPSRPGWDGTFNGKDLPSSDYWFVLSYQEDSGEDRQFKSHFTLKR